MPLYITRGHNGDWDREMLRRSGNDKWLDLLEGCLAPNFKNRLQTINDVTRLMPAPTGVKINTGSGIRHDFITDLSRGVTLRVMQGEDLGRTYRLNEFFRDNSSVLTVGRDSADRLEQYQDTRAGDMLYLALSLHHRTESARQQLDNT